MTIALQPFAENDLIEPRMRDCALPSLVILSEDRDAFFEGAYEAAPLGDVLWNLGRDPLSGVLTLTVFRTAYPAIHEIFTRPGTFEFYLEVFRAIWGEDVDVQFTVPGPGKLLISIGEIDIGTFDLAARRIVDDEYIYDVLIDQEDDVILAQDIVGTKTQAEVDLLIKEISPASIWTVATLEL